MRGFSIHRSVNARFLCVKYGLRRLENIENEIDERSQRLTKRDMKHTVLGQHKSTENNDVTDDRPVRVAYYPEPFRLATISDPKTGDAITFVTNKFERDAATIAEVLRSRLQIETFFKWIKRNLKIKSFQGTPKNAVMTQSGPP